MQWRANQPVFFFFLPSSSSFYWLLEIFTAAFVLTANLPILLCWASFVVLIGHEVGKCVCLCLGDFVSAHTILVSSSCDYGSSPYAKDVHFWTLPPWATWHTKVQVPPRFSSWQTGSQVQGAMSEPGLQEQKLLNIERTDQVPRWSFTGTKLHKQSERSLAGSRPNIQGWLLGITPLAPKSPSSHRTTRLTIVIPLLLGPPSYCNDKKVVGMADSRIRVSGQVIQLAEPQFLHLQNGNSNSNYIMGLVRNKIIQVKWLKPHLAIVRFQIIGCHLPSN